MTGRAEPGAACTTANAQASKEGDPDMKDRRQENSEMPDLQNLYTKLNRRWWRGRLPLISLRWSRRMHAIAGKYWSSSSKREIVLSVPYHQKFPEEIEDTLKHEMIHLYLHLTGGLRRGLSHGEEFRAEAARVGASIHCKTYEGTHRPYRYIWECPNCTRRSRSRVRRVWACKPCCTTHNGGYYSPRFKLRLVRGGSSSLD